MFDLLDVLAQNSYGDALQEATIFGGGEATLYTVPMTILVILVGIILYFGPSLIAFYRNKRNTLAIFVGNILLGWNAILWMLLLVWSLTYSYEDESFRQK